MKNEIKLFENKELEFQVRTMLNEDGSISVNTEDTATGYGWYREKNGKEYIMWDRFNGYCKELGFPHKCGKDDYIPESLFYMLGFKAGNEKALAYQQWLAMDVLPTLRKTGSYEMPKKEKKETKSKQIPLPSINTMVKNITKSLEKAGVDDLYIAAEVKRIYTDAGYPVNVPLVTDKETMPKLYDCTEIAKEIGIMSISGKPHKQAVSAIISKLDIEESEIITTAFSKYGHDDVTTQYKPSVFDKAKQWLIDNNYPVKISYTDAKGNYKTYTVSYRSIEIVS